MTEKWASTTPTALATLERAPEACTDAKDTPANLEDAELEAEAPSCATPAALPAVLEARQEKATAAL